MIQTYQDYYELNKDDKHLQVLSLEMDDEETVKMLSDSRIKSFISTLLCMSSVWAKDKRYLHDYSLVSSEGKTLAVLESLPSFFLGHEVYNDS